MIKSDIVKELMGKLPISKNHAIEVVDLITNTLKGHLVAGGRIEIRGFGVFENRPRKRGEGRNIKTGVRVAIPVGRSIRFKPGMNLRNLAGEDEG